MNDLSISQQIEQLTDTANGPVKSHDLGRCHLWTGKLGCGQDRPAIIYNGKTIMVRRVAYQMFHKCTLTVRDRIYITCGTPTCVNPKHLVRNKVQLRDDDYCTRGHKMTPLNTYRRTNGGVQCYICKVLESEGRL